MPMMYLYMRDRDRPSQDLMGGDDGMETDSMSFCVTVMVFYNRVNGSYQNGRGQHVSGAGNGVNLASLFNGVPNQQDTRIFIVAGPLNSPQDYSLEKFVDEVRLQRPAATLTLHFASRCGALRNGTLSLNGGPFI